MVGLGVEGVIILGYEDCYVRFFDVNSGKFYNGYQCFGYFFLLIQLFRLVYL